MKELKDTQGAPYPYVNIIMPGDFNDDLSGTMTTELLPGTTTSYIDFIHDSADYKPFMQPLGLLGECSAIRYAGEPDASCELSSRYFVVERSGSEPVNTVFYFL